MVRLIVGSDKSPWCLSSRLVIDRRFVSFAEKWEGISGKSRALYLQSNLLSVKSGARAQILAILNNSLESRASHTNATLLRKQARYSLTICSLCTNIEYSSHAHLLRIFEEQVSSLFSEDILLAVILKHPRRRAIELHVVWVVYQLALDKFESRTSPPGTQLAVFSEGRVQ
jgi:hypothetical protein